MIALATPAGAQQQCNTRQKVVDHLTTKGALPQTRGLDGAGNMVETWASQKGGWAIVVTRPDMTSCIVGAGEWFDRLPAKFGERV